MSVTRNGRRALTISATAALAGTCLFSGVGHAAIVAPTVKSASSSIGLANGVAVSLTGTGFRSATNGLVVTGATVFVAASGTTAAPACSGSGGTAVTSFSNISATKITVKTPDVHTTLSGFSTPASSAKAVICLAYTDTTTKYVAVPFVVALQPVKHASTPLAPTSGLQTGGQTITLATTTATAWPVGSTVTVDGVAATGVKIATNGQSLTAVTPAGATPGAKDVVVRAPGFAPVTLAAAYTYVNGITVSPQTGVTGSTSADDISISISGSGFTGPSFNDSDPSHSGALTAPRAVNVLLWAGASSSGAKVTVACTNVLVISDSELSCDVPHSANAVLYRVIVANQPVYEDAEAASISVLSTSSVFTLADF